MSFASTRPCVSHERTSSASIARLGFAAAITAAIASASSTRTSRSTRELLLVHHPADHRLHARALVHAERARVALGVDTETDAALAAFPEADEGVLEQSAGDAAAAPWAAREERVDPAAAVETGDGDRPSGDLVPGADDAPQRRIELL